MFATGSNNIFDANSGFKAHWKKEKDEKKKKKNLQWRSKSVAIGAHFMI